MTCGYKACTKELFLLLDWMLKLEKADKLLGTETLFPTFLAHLTYSSTQPYLHTPVPMQAKDCGFGDN